MVNKKDWYNQRRIKRELIMDQSDLYDYYEKCKGILNWSEQNKKFDSSAIEGIFGWIQDNEITSSQIQAIDNVLFGFEIDLSQYLN